MMSVTCGPVQFCGDSDAPQAKAEYAPVTVPGNVTVVLLFGTGRLVVPETVPPSFELHGREVAGCPYLSI